MTHLLYLTESLCPQSWMFFLLPQKKHFLHFTLLIQSFCWNTELFLWNTKKVAAHFLSQKPTLYPAPLWDPDDRFRCSGTNLSSSIKTSWQFLKEKKNRRRKYQLLSVEKKSQRTQLFVLQKSNSHQQHSSTISIRKLMNWDTLWKQNGWTEKYFIAEK